MPPDHAAPSVENSWIPFEEHQRRRDRGLGCISLIVGSRSEAVRALNATGRSLVIPPEPGAEIAIAAYAKALVTLCDLRRQVIEAVAVPDWSDLDQETQARRIALSPLDDPARRLAAALLFGTDQPAIRTVKDLAELLRFAAGAALPILFIPAVHLGDNADYLIAILEATPQVPLVVNLSFDAAADLDRQADRGDRLAAVLREGAIRLTPLPQPPVPAMPFGDEAISCDSIFDSQAEALLSGLLEADPLTAGLFAPQGEPGFLMGNRQPARIDLLCKTLRIAIEIDGPYHFTHTQYRRDRYKDLELQQAGYLVLRFLSEDVMDAGESVRDRIRAAVLWCVDGRCRSDSV